MKSRIPLRPKDYISELSQSEQSGLSYYVISGCSKKDAFILFCRPDMLASKAKAAIDDYIKQFFARKEVKEYIEAYSATLDSFLRPEPQKEQKPIGSIEERKAKAKLRLVEFAMSLTDNIEQAEDPEFVLKMADKAGLLDGDEQVEVAPQRFLGERCSDCRYRVFCEQECEDLCQYCKYKQFGEDNGVHYKNEEMIDMPVKIGTELEGET